MHYILKPDIILLTICCIGFSFTNFSSLDWVLTLFYK